MKMYTVRLEKSRLNMISNRCFQDFILTLRIRRLNQFFV
jgi:hypothetical protein